MDGFKFLNGKCEDILPTLPENSIDTCLTDPPYEISMLAKQWDKTGVSFQPETWKHVLRILKPGGFLLAFGGTRTWHRMVCAIEDAGFEIRDAVAWVHAQGMPKSLDISKAFDDAAGVERVVVGPPKYSKGKPKQSYSETRKVSYDCQPLPQTEPATDEAKKWQGWGTGIKPAFELIVVAMKPLEGTFARNAQQWGVSGLAIDKCRIGFASEADEKESKSKNQHEDLDSGPRDNHSFGKDSGPRKNYDPPGRWPANLVLDPVTAALLDQQSGWTKTKRIEKPSDCGGNTWGGTIQGHRGARGYTDEGGASRFFFCAKASPSERGSYNDHVTVKPLALMEWLCNLTSTPDGGTVLDPFMGSGTTGLACYRTKRKFIGIDKDPHYVEIAERRLREEAEGHPPGIFE